MEMFCPECRAVLVTNDGATAQCPAHGGTYQILFSHWRAPVLQPVPVPPPLPPEAFAVAPPPIAPVSAGGLRLAAPLPVAQRSIGVAIDPPPGSTCRQHPHAAAAFMCRNCGVPLCPTCAFAEKNGNRYCPECMRRRVVLQPGFLEQSTPLIVPPVGSHCRQHPQVQAIRTCKLCGSFMCATCDFELPGGVHVCPGCASAPRTALSPRRKKFLIASLCLGGWSTIALAVLFSGLLAGAANDKALAVLVGLAFLGMAFVPALVGLAMGLSARDKRLDNPPWIAIAIVWNSLLVGGFLLMMIVGMLKGG